MQDVLRDWGWAFDSACTSSICTVTAVPQLFGYPLPAGSLPEFLTTLGAAGHTARRQDIPDAVHTLLQSISCRGAIMFGQTLTHSEACALVSSLAQTKLPFHCAHGRPTAACILSMPQLRRFIASHRRVSGPFGKVEQRVENVQRPQLTAPQLKRRLERHLRPG